MFQLYHSKIFVSLQHFLISIMPQMLLTELEPRKFLELAFIYFIKKREINVHLSVFLEHLSTCNSYA